jgi:DNA-binding MarR family transcriptional regulator
MKKEHLDNCYENIIKDEREVFGLTLPITLIYKQLFSGASILLQKEFDLVHSEIDVMIALFFNGKIMTPTALYEATLFSSGGMTKVLKKLEKRGFISRIPSSKDKRSMLVKLTSQGESTVEKSLHLLVKRDNEVFEVLDKQEREVLSKILKKLVYSLI